jgi:hypothetical protein
MERYLIMNMPILASANPLVGHEYERLEDVLRPGQLPKKDTLDQGVSNYVAGALRSLAPDITDSLPSDGTDLEVDHAVYLLERFRDAVSIDVDSNKPSLSAGDVSFQFSCLVYYFLGVRAKTLGAWQQERVLDICQIAETRPLPVKRWTEFVRTNIYDAERVRTVMASCIYSKTLLRSRLTTAVTAVSWNFQLSNRTYILAIGSSGTVRDALVGISKLTKIKVYSTCPTPGVPFNGTDLGFEVTEITDDEILREESSLPKFDLVVMGCGVIGKTEANEIEVVSWARAVNVAKKIRSDTVQLLVIAGLYKIWPQHFYERNKDSALDLREQSGSFHAILTDKDIDWLITEYKPFKLPEIPSWIRFLFDARSVDVTTSFSLCEDDAFFQKIVQSEEVYKIDRRLATVKSLLNFERIALGQVDRTSGPLIGYEAMRAARRMAVEGNKGMVGRIVRARHRAS